MDNEKNNAHSERVVLRTQTGFGSFIRSERIRRGATQEQLARTVRKSRRWLQDVERGRVAPSLIAAIELTAALGYDLLAERSRPSQLLDDVFRELS